jgi:regulator of sigma E protease
VSEGRIGIAPNFSMRRAGPVESIVSGSLRTYYSLYFLIHTLEKRQTEEVGGPILMGQMTTAMQKLGIAHLLTMAAGLSLSLGVMNLLPIPILDGGHLLLLSLEKLRRRRLSTREMVGAQMVGLGLIAMLMIFVMYNDIARTLSGNAPK